MSNNRRQPKLFNPQNAKQQNGPGIPESLFRLVDHYRKQKLLLPDYQRDFVWEEHQVADWAKAIKQIVDDPYGPDPIGCIVTYNIVGEHMHYEQSYPLYLCDGSQRVRATDAILRDPQKYGFGDSDELIEILNEFMLPVQHRHYRDDDEALEWFQRLNKTTGLHPADRYKGHLVNIEGGKDLYESIIQTVNEVDMYIAQKRNIKYGRRRIFDRSALALFYQYSCGVEDAKLYQISAKVANDNVTPVEMRLRQAIDDNGIEEMKRKLTYFRSYLQGQRALLEQKLLEHGKENQLYNMTLFRACLHFSLYLKNRGYPKQAFVRWIDIIIKNSTLTATIFVPTDQGYENLSISDMDKCKRVGRLHGVAELQNEKHPRRKKGNGKPGYDRSHKLPFSMHGEGETVYEPAPLNRSRGAKPMEGYGDE